MSKKVLLATASVLALATSTGPASACSSHGLIASGEGPAGTGALFFPVPITLAVQHSAQDPGYGVATVSTFQVAATIGHTCAVAVALSPMLVIESLEFVDANDRYLAFSEFAPSKKLTREFHQGGGDPSFRVFTAEVDTTILPTLAKLEIQFRARQRGLTVASLVDLFARSRIATGRVEGDSGFMRHLAVVRPALVVACLGDPDPGPDGDGLSTCPAHDHAH